MRSETGRHGGDKGGGGGGAVHIQDEMRDANTYTDTKQSNHRIFQDSRLLEISHANPNIEYENLRNAKME